MPPVKFVVDSFFHIPLIYIRHRNLHHSYCKDFRLEIAVIHSRFQQFGSDDFMFVFSVSSDAVEVSNDGSFFFQVSLSSSKPR